jgi:hypothetical protein
MHAMHARMHSSHALKPGIRAMRDQFGNFSTTALVSGQYRYVQFGSSSRVGL